MNLAVAVNFPPMEITTGETPPLPLPPLPLPPVKTMTATIGGVEQIPHPHPAPLLLPMMASGGEMQIHPFQQPRTLTTIPPIPGGKVPIQSPVLQHSHGSSRT